MSRPREDVPARPALGAIVLSIARGNKRTTKIAKDLNRKHPTVIEQLGFLESGKWIKRSKETKEYQINYDKLADYYIEKFKIKQEKTLKQNLPLWFQGFSQIPCNTSIDAIGVCIKMLEGDLK